MNDEIKEARKRAENALKAFDAVGGIMRRGGGKHYLALNVKCYDSVEVPEFKDDEALMQQVYEWEAHDFWNFDFEDVENHDKYFGEQDLPEIGSIGRSGGHLVFMGTERAADSFRVYGSGTIEDALCEMESIDANDPDEDPQIISDAYESLAEYFESATKWVEHVKVVMMGRIKNILGEHKEWIELHIENLRYELFDIGSATIIGQGDGTFQVAWPEHARKFKDSDGEETFSFNVDKETLIDMLAPEVARAAGLLSSVGKGK